MSNDQHSVHPQHPISAALTSCDREPIHLPGSIQPHGVLLVLDEAKLTVVQASENVALHLGFTAEQCGGRPIAELLGADLAQRLESELGSLHPLTRPTYLGP